MSPNVLYMFVLCVLVHCYCSTGSLSRTRIISEWKDISKSGLDLSVPFNFSASDCGIRLSPLRNNLLEWHFSFIGMENSSFEGGVYHGKIRLHPEYPRKAPVISVSTPSGRWEINTPICLSASAHHQELWNPDWNLRTLVLSLRNFMTSQPGEIGSLHATPEVHRRLAHLSRSFICKECGTVHGELVPKLDAERPSQGLPKLFLRKSDEKSTSNECTTARIKKKKSVKKCKSIGSSSKILEEKHGVFKAKTRATTSLGVLAKKVINGVSLLVGFFIWIIFQ